MATSSARKILKTLLSSSPSCDSATSSLRTPSSSGTTAAATSASTDSNSVSDASDVRGVVAMDGLLKYEDLMALLTCSQCQKFCGNSIVQCRKGHVICKACKVETKITSCKICKQTFVDAPNVVLEKLISMIALPCRFRATGCAQFIFPDKKIEHETLCPYRVMSCQYSAQGCTEEMPYKEISAHHRHCQFRPPKRASLSSLARNESMCSNHSGK